MSDDLNQLADVIKDETTTLVIDGGEGGGKLVLTRAEMNLFRRLNDPLNDQERTECTQTLLHTMRVAKSLRTKITAVNAITAMQRKNLLETKAYIASKALVMEGAKAKGNSGVVVNVQIVEQVVVREQVVTNGRNGDNHH